MLFGKSLTSFSVLLGVTLVSTALVPVVAYENGAPHISTSEGSAFFSKKVFNKLGYFDNSRFSSDTDYWHRMEVLSRVSPELDIKIGSHPTPLIVGYLRVNKDNLTAQIPISHRGNYC